MCQFLNDSIVVYFFALCVDKDFKAFLKLQSNLKAIPEYYIYLCESKPVFFTDGSFQSQDNGKETVGPLEARMWTSCGVISTASSRTDHEPIQTSLFLQQV